MKIPIAMRLPKEIAIRTLLVACFAASVGSVVACRHDDEEHTAKARVEVRTVVVTPSPFTETLDAIGVVVPRAGHLASLSAPVASRITQVFVSNGQHVRAGQPLVQLDRATLEAGQHSADASLTVAERAYARAQRLAQEGIVPRKDIDQAAADLAKARADAILARRTASLATLRAPMSGIITRMSATLGATADPNQPLVDIADPSALDIVLNLSAQDVARVRPSALVTLTTGQGSTATSLGSASVWDIGGAVDSATRAVAVRARPLTTVRPLRVGETVFGHITVAQLSSAIVVPVEALVPEGDAFKVFVVDAAGIAHARPVEVDGRTDSTAHITQGLSAGERIVTSGAYGVEDSVAVVQRGAASASASRTTP